MRGVALAIIFAGMCLPIQGVREHTDAMYQTLAAFQLTVLGAAVICIIWGK